MLYCNTRLLFDVNIFDNQELNLFFKELADSPEEQVEELRDLWRLLKKEDLKKLLWCVLFLYEALLNDSIDFYH